MQLSPDFKVTAKSMPPDEALALAHDIEWAVGQMLAGKLKPGKIRVELLMQAVQVIRDYVKPAAPALPEGWTIRRDGDELVLSRGEAGIPERWRYRPSEGTGTDSAFIYDFLAALAPKAEG